MEIGLDSRTADPDQSLQPDYRRLANAKGFSDFSDQRATSSLPPQAEVCPTQYLADQEWKVA
jgi:hypothetical protein